MAYLYISKDFYNLDVNHQRIAQRHIEAIKSSENPDELLENFRNQQLYKKRANTLRIILQKFQIQIYDKEYYVYYLRNVFTRDSREYKELKDDPQRWLTRNQISKDEIAEISQWLKSEIDKENESKKLPELPESLQKLLYQGRACVFQSTIFETQEWIESIKSEDMSLYKMDICENLIDIVDGKVEHNIRWKETKNKRDFILAEFDKQIFIFYEKIYIENNSPLFLLYKTLRGPAPDNEYLKKILSRYNFEVSENIREEVIRKAKRAYPDYILLDVDLWAKIEEDDIANLALSPEEELLLESATFPMFINGQAGSGKSTMLFYLFAHFCNLINSSEHNIIF